jgi:hypothetical protein
MSYNGSGTFIINSAGQPVVANTVISATVFNALTADLASGLTNCITKDGQSTPTANIPMGNNKITGLGAGTAATDAATLGQVQSTAAKLITVTGTDTISGTMSPALTAYASGQLFYFIANAANTGAMTINIDGLGAKNITRDGSTALIAGDVNTGEIVVICYDGTRFQMINAANSFGNTTINGTLTVTGNTGLQANVSITSALSVGGVFAVTGAATLGSTLLVTGKSDLPTVSTASMNAAVAVVTTGTVTNLTATSASIASMNAGVALLTTATVTTLTATGASIASANIGNLQFTAASIASINAGVAVITNLTVTGASIASMNGSVANITTVNATTVDATNVEVTNVKAKDGTAAITIADSTGLVTAGAGLTLSGGNLNFSGTAQRITGDMSNATIANRVAFQTSTANTFTDVIALPNGTGTLAQFAAYANSNPANTSFGSLRATDSTDVRLLSGITGTGTYLPMTFYTGGSERMRLDTAGQLGLGVVPSAWASGNRFIDINNSASFGAFGDTDSMMLANAFWNGSNWVRKVANNAFRMTMESVSGSPSWTFQYAANSTAGSTISWSEAMRIDSSGNVGIGGTANAFVRCNIVGTLPTDSNISIGFSQDAIIPSGTTSIYAAFNSAATTQAASFTLSNYVHYRTSQPTFGAGSTVTNQFGFFAESNLTGATNNYGFYSNIASGANRWNFYAAGTANNYFAGNVGIGGTAGGNVKTQLLGSFPVIGGNANTNGIAIAMEVPSAITGNAFVFRSLPSISASTATTNVYQYAATNVTLGSGATLTNNYGFFADAMTSATNNYGFYSDIASGSNRWNFYANGTAENYVANNLKIGGTAARATTAGTAQLVLFDGTAPAGTLANGVSFYSAAGEANVMDAAGNATLLSPHDSETNEWIFRSKHTPTGKVLKIDVEKMLRFINEHFGLDMVHEFTE